MIKTIPSFMCQKKGNRNMIQSEKDLEDYICEHTQNFIIFLNGLYKNDRDIGQIRFIGRQIKLGSYFADLLFDSVFVDDNKMKIRTFIVVELKFRNLKANDLGQLCKYLNLLQCYSDEKDETIDCIFTKGILLGFDLDDDMQEIEMYLQYVPHSNIKICRTKSDIKFDEALYEYKEEYENNLKFDERLRNE